MLIVEIHACSMPIPRKDGQDVPENCTSNALAMPRVGVTKLIVLHGEGV